MSASKAEPIDTQKAPEGASGKWGLPSGSVSYLFRQDEVLRVLGHPVHVHLVVQVR